MKFSLELSAFNRRIADVLLPTFAANVDAVQASDGTLLFRGPISASDPHVGSHVAVSLEPEVQRTLDNAPPPLREELTELLVSNLSSQVTALYNPARIGTFALDVVGTMNILR